MVMYQNCLGTYNEHFEGLGVLNDLMLRHKTTTEQWKKKTGCLGFIGDYTTHQCGDYNPPL